MNIHGINSVGTLNQVTGGYATLSGSFTGSFKGDGSQLTNLPTVTVDTGSLVTTASFNAYTSSTNGRLNNIESTTASLNTATSSLFASASLALVTASFNNGTRNLTFTKGDNQTFSVNIPDVSGSAGDFVTTSSFNAYTSSNDQKVNSLISATGSYAKLSGGNTFSGVQNISDSVNILGSNSLNFNLNIEGSGSQYPGVAMNVDTTTYPSDIFAGIGVGDNNKTLTIIQMAANAYTPEYTSQVVGWFGGGGNNASGSNTAFIMRTGSAELEIFKPISAKFDMNLNGAFTASLQQGYVWVGNASGRTTTVATSSFGTTINTGSFVTTSSFNTYTSSTNTRLNNIETTTASLNTSVTNINTFTASAQTSINALNVATASLNTFSSSTLTRLTNIESTTASLNTSVTNLNTATASLFTSASLGLVTASVTNNTITFTKGDASTFNITVNTGSAGGAAFPYTGDAVITGSLLISGSGIPDLRVIGNIALTGSLSGQPITLSVASNTASIDMTAGNNFVLTLPSSSTTHIKATSILAGQTINLLVKQQVGPATGSITFSPTILFPAGLDMQATATGSAIDLVSMISFDTTNLIAANVKNLK
ncbi:hypothetical protein UFOVP1475_32 [uncultured Caudovirales phage]|uniref:Uncharacterized protein n=1 Tax=uncultured Caudovirales phage TaxID=2100421 RepID=A0A6J5SL18_9CAUD|nr:hypothetical protein UFOVP1475_32 [uncultured Caudovirales phage]